LIKNYHFRRKFQMALRGFCIWTLQIYTDTQNGSEQEWDREVWAPVSN